MIINIVVCKRNNINKSLYIIDYHLQIAQILIIYKHIYKIY